MVDQTGPWSSLRSLLQGRALQASALKAWGGRKDKLGEGAKVFMSRARANGQATKGQFGGEAANGESLHVKGYKY